MRLLRNGDSLARQTGLIDSAAQKSALDMLAQFTPELKDAKIDLSATFDDRFAKKAAAGK